MEAIRKVEPPDVAKEKGEGMNFKDVAFLIKDVGFAIFVATYLLTQLPTQLQGLKDEVRSLTVSTQELQRTILLSVNLNNGTKAGGNTP